MKKRILDALETLEAIYFLTQSLEGEAWKDITKIRAGLDNLPRRSRPDVLRAIGDDIKMLRAHYGALAPNPRFRELLAEARKMLGYAYMPKIYIDRKLFRHYEKVFPRWPHIPLHACVIFDGQTNHSTRQLFTLEAALFSDAKILLQSARHAHKGIETIDFRRRGEEDQRALLAYLRSLASVIFHFLEAYLNGLAHDCFQIHHDKLAIVDHDLLAEWDSRTRSRRFVGFEKKMFEYPAIAARKSGRGFDGRKAKSSKILLDYGKKLRDAITHPSPYVDPHSGYQEKTSLIATINLALVEKLFESAKEYVVAVEDGLGRDPGKTIPWIFKE